MGKALVEARNRLGISRKDVQDRISREFKQDVGETTIRAAENDQFPNPGIKTIEMIARAVDLPPLEVIALHLEEPPPETKQRFSRSRFAVISEIYDMLPADRQIWYDDMLEMIIERMRKG